MCSAVRNHIPDMLWGQAMVSALFLLAGENATERKILFLTALLLSISLECLQLLPAVGGTFDLWDIAAEVFAETAAAFYLEKELRRRSK